MELSEIVLTGLNLKNHFATDAAVAAIDAIGIKDIMIEFVKQYVPAFGTVILVLEGIFIAYALGNFIVNVFPDFAKKINPNLSLAH